METLAIEVAPFGVQATLLEPGAVSSGALDNVTSYTLPDDPYAGLAGDDDLRAAMITPEQVATRSPTPPKSRSCHCGFRSAIPRAQCWRRAAPPDDVPFVPAG